MAALQNVCASQQETVSEAESLHQRLLKSSAPVVRRTSVQSYLDFLEVAFPQDEDPLFKKPPSDNF